ncbi:hypothetical protein [Mycobacterium sp. SMC-13]|uniref:hypothetical protein n=1 Tax=Mycobacterium sp. SMC-13 TaxID=3381626 RepID=UPI00387666BF
MSPQKDLPEHNDEPTTEAIIAYALRDHVGPGRDWIAPHVVEALKEAGFEITKRSELGVTKGLPGIAAEAGIRALKQLTTGMKFPPPPEPDRVLAYPTWGLEYLAPGASTAAQTGMDIANRTIAYGSLNPDEALKLALELIGRRSDVVAVQLPEPLRERIWPIVIGGETETVWLNPAANEDLIVVSGTCTLDATEARNLAAALLAAAARVDAAEGEAK